MKAIEPKNTTHIMRAPKTWNADEAGADCDDLYTIVEDTGGTRTITSIWKPSEDELRALNCGHGIMLMVYSRLMPPVMLDVTGEPL